VLALVCPQPPLGNARGQCCRRATVGHCVPDYVGIDCVRPCLRCHPRRRPEIYDSDCTALQVVGRLALARVGRAPRLPPRACSAEDDTGGANGGSTSRAAGITRTVPTRAESAEQRSGTEPGVFSIRCWHSQFRSPGPGACPSMSFLQRQGTGDRFRSSSWILSSLRWQTNSSRRTSTTHWRPPCCGDCCARYFAGENNGGARPRGAPQFLETGASPHGFGERYFKSAATASRPAFAHSSS
jgi:hypothetical protein